MLYDGPLIFVRTTKSKDVEHSGVVRRGRTSVERHLLAFFHFFFGVSEWQKFKLIK